jgi:uncharacterized protein (TIGR02594 family)
MDKNKAKETWQNEKDKVKWVVYNDKCVKCLDGNGNNFSACFAKEGTYKIQAYCDNSPEKIKPTKVIKIGIPKFEDAFWIFASGDKTCEAGLNQEVACVVEAKSFAGRKCEIIFWGDDIRFEESGMPKFNPDNATQINKTQKQGEFDSEGKLIVTFKLTAEICAGDRWDFEQHYIEHQSEYEDKFNKTAKKPYVFAPVYFTLCFDDNFDDMDIQAAKGLYKFEYRDDQKTHYYVSNNNIQISNKPQVCHFEFIDVKTGRPQIAPVTIGENVMLSAQTINMEGEKITFELYFELTKDAVKIVEYEVEIKEDGLAEQNPITIKEEWLGEELQKPIHAKLSMKKADGKSYTPAAKYNCNPEYVSITITKDETQKASTLCNGLAVGQWTKYNLRKKCFRCGAPITIEELEAILDSNSESKSFRTEILNVVNSYVSANKIHLSTCADKAHFIAQIATETGILKDNLVEKGKYTKERFQSIWKDKSTFPKIHNDAAFIKDCEEDTTGRTLFNYIYGIVFKVDTQKNPEEGYTYRGRGLIQLTGRGNYKAAVTYIRDNFKENIPDFEQEPDKVAESQNAILTALYFWETKCMYTQTQWGCEASDAVNLRYCVGGFQGLETTKKYLTEAAKVFKVSECENSFIKNRKTRKKGDRAPWMEIVQSEANFAKGKPESDNPLFTMIKEKYFAHVKCYNLNPKTDGWCAAFSSWALSKAGYGNPMSPRSGDWLKNVKLVEISEPCYGAIVVIQNYDLDKKWKGGSGHITFVYGQMENNGNWLCLGGNQGNFIKISQYKKKDEWIEVKDENGKLSYYQKVEGFYLPVDYNLKEDDKLTDQDKSYKNIKNLNSEGESTI